MVLLENCDALFASCLTMLKFAPLTCNFLVVDAWAAGYLADTGDSNAADVTGLLKDSMAYKKAMRGLMSGEHGTADDISTELWEFIWTELMPKVVPTPGRNANNLFHPKYHREVDAAALMGCVNASDEALVLTILSVKGLALAELASTDDAADDAGDNDTASQLTEASSEKENQGTSARSTYSGRVRKRGRTKNRSRKITTIKKDYEKTVKVYRGRAGHLHFKPGRGFDQAGENSEVILEEFFTFELGSYVSVYNSFFGKIEDCRRDDGKYGWCSAIAKTINGMRKEAQEDTVAALAAMTNMPTAGMSDQNQVMSNFPASFAFNLDDVGESYGI